MKAHTITNAEIVIQANVNKPGDWDKVKAVAAKMVADTATGLDYASQDEAEQWIHLCTVWGNFQADEIKEAYNAAKAA